MITWSWSIGSSYVRPILVMLVVVFSEVMLWPLRMTMLASRRKLTLSSMEVSIWKLVSLVRT
jgi:hypothetical protein